MRRSGAGGSGRSGRAAAEPALRAEAQPCARCSVCASCGSIAERSWHGRQWRWRLRPRVARQAAVALALGFADAGSLSISAPRALPRSIGEPDVAAGSDGTLVFFSGRIAIRRPTGAGTKARALTDPAYATLSPRSSSIRSGVSPSPGYVRADSPLRRRCGARGFIQARSATPSGRWGPIETLGRVGYDPALAIAPEAGGGATVAWEADNAVNVARHDVGRRFGRAVSFTRNGPEDGGVTALATSADGRAYVAFATAPRSELEQDRPESRGRGRGARSHGSLERTAAGLRPPRGTAADHGCRGRDRRRRVA